MSILLREHSECCLKKYFDKLMDVRGQKNSSVLYICCLGLPSIPFLVFWHHKPYFPWESISLTFSGFGV